MEPGVYGAMSRLSEAYGEPIPLDILAVELEQEPEEAQPALDVLVAGGLVRVYPRFGAISTGAAKGPDDDDWGLARHLAAMNGDNCFARELDVWWDESQAADTRRARYLSAARIALEWIDLPRAQS